MGIQPNPDNYAQLENLLRDFIAQRPQTITSPRDLAERMAGKAILIKDVLFNALRTDTDLQTELTGQYLAFKEHLIHDIEPADFADIYAETIAYGMFAARLHDTHLDTFSRQEALELLPKSNPFLRSLFGYVAGVDLDDRIAWIIDDLAAVFQATNVKKIMAGFGKLTAQQDPFLHFYETFLAAYNPAKRKARGVWYTPEPVVNFIVRAVDEVLQTEFGLPDGLADTSKVTLDWDTGQTDNKGKPVTIKKEVHRVQILDPATGTGTFLAEVIKQIAPKIQGVAPGMWSGYIENDLIPRLHGFELLMASYAMCHMKLDMILTEMGYKPSKTPPRLSVYLTNSLEEGEPATQNLLFSQWLSREAKGANTIKRDMPIMCVIGNPPYSGISQNMGEYISRLIDDYKYVDGVHFGERKHSLHDDYVKFIRLSESLIEKSGEGVLGFITSHGYLDNPTFRGMRWHLLQTFDKIHVFDLHGNSKRGEIPPEGIRDENVFDIQQGVSIIIAVKIKPCKRKFSTEGCEVAFSEMWGSRIEKYEQLGILNIEENSSKKIIPTAPYFSFNGKGSRIPVYQEGFSIPDIFPLNTTGVQTSRDSVALAESIAELQEKVLEISDPRISTDFIRKKYFSQTSKKFPAGDTRDWKLETERLRIPSKNILEHIVPYAFRPLDNRKIALHPTLVSWPRMDVSKHMLRSNIALITARSNKKGVNHFYCSAYVSDVKCGEATTGSIFAPLYLYPDEQDLDQTRRVNFDPKLYAKLRKLATHPDHGTPDELAVFDYIYGVLHCPAYRATYAEFLKIDFPRIPWPKTPAEFWDVSAKGHTLRQLHLMDPATIGPTPFPFMGDGDNTVEKPRYEDGKIWINPTQYFDAAPPVSWDFYIGGYQPAQKWLKDRKGRALTFDDVKHYQRILKILSETDRVMKTIEMELSE
ncbi:type ISP restriction/modification enzyme [Roseinatronobacter monicus]|nr:type ISP restriction/modification enzyme [Roseinatronobacter monicus]